VLAPWQGRAAQAAVEFALVVPVFLLITAGTLEFGRGFFAYAQLMQAVQDGTRYGAVLGNAGDTPGITQRVQLLAPGGINDAVTVICSLPTTPSVGGAPCTRSNLLTVTAQHRQATIIPIFPLPALNEQVTVTMVIE
jgi:Flp pilus assembly protein TadG